MLSHRHIAAVFCTLCSLGLAAGCGDRNVAPSSGAPPATTTTAVVAPPGESAAAGGDPPVTPTSTEGPTEAGDGETPAEGSAQAYAPPFPDRVDLFVPPKRQGGASSALASSERAVDLMGFIRVDTPRAILSINGQVFSVAEGESIDGIEVLSVQPPSALLRRGRQRWQATIE